MEDETMTIQEVSTYLKTKEKAAYASAIETEIAGFKAPGSGGFLDEEINRWIQNCGKYHAEDQ